MPPGPNREFLTRSTMHEDIVARATLQDESCAMPRVARSVKFGVT